MSCRQCLKNFYKTTNPDKDDMVLLILYIIIYGEVSRPTFVGS